jgi:hypothetical protein
MPQELAEQDFSPRSGIPLRCQQFAMQVEI